MICNVCRSTVERLKNGTYICKDCCDIISEDGVLDDYDITIPEGEFWILWSKGEGIGAMGLARGTFVDVCQTENTGTIMICISSVTYDKLSSLIYENEEFKKESEICFKNCDKYEVTGSFKFPTWKKVY